MGKSNISLSNSLDKLPPTSDMVDTSSSLRSRHFSSGANAGLPSIAGAPIIPDYPALPGLVHYRTTNGVKNGNVIFHNQCDIQRRSLIEKGYDGEDSEESVSERKGRSGSERVGARAYIVLAILLLANLINYMDRYTIAGKVHLPFITVLLFSFSFIFSFFFLYFSFNDDDHFFFFIAK